VARALRACSSPILSWGIEARVLSSSVVAWVGSSSEVAPALKRASAIENASSWIFAFCSAWAISTSKVRITTYVRATSAVSETRAA
jgi:hypothetical protein